MQVLLAQLHHLVYRVSGSDAARPAAAHQPPPTATAPGLAAGGGATVTTSLVALMPLQGPAVLSLLSELARSGLPALQSTVSRLLWHCNQTLFKQLTSWCAHPASGL